MVNVLFVCLGNICRSPSAEGMFRALVEREGLDDHISTDSAGTGAYHTGNPPDGRAQAAARNRGVEIGDLRARQARREDFGEFQYVIAMDRSNRDDLLAICPADHEDRVHLFMDFASGTGQAEVPDPYYGGDGGFETVLDMLEDASRGLLAHIRATDLTGDR